MVKTQSDSFNVLHLSAVRKTPPGSTAVAYPIKRSRHHAQKPHEDPGSSCLSVSPSPVNFALSFATEK